MHPHDRVHEKDEELGKRSDDLKPRRSPTASSLLQPWRWRKRRLLWAVAVTASLCYGVHLLSTGWIPSLDAIRASPSFPLPAPRPGSELQEPIGPPPRQRVARSGEGSDKHYYEGILKYYRLAASLHGIVRTMGGKPDNRNILFAVSSLKSAANLIPMACEMARWDRNYVHMILLGRDPLSLDDILTINGVTLDDCNVYFHDGRPDYTDYSTDDRAEASVHAAMRHVWDFMHPQAMIMDDSSEEDDFFVRAMRLEGAKMRRPIIEIPTGRYEEFFWMTRLDSGGLRNWFRPTIDILIHAPPDSSGGLLRLVKSLEGADYGGLRVPKLSIELPQEVTSFVRRFLESVNWPPVDDASPLAPSTLTVRHRVFSAHLSSEHAAVRFLESFYPKNLNDHHVLVLSAEAELSPLYLQYLHYVILEYKYSSYAIPEAEHLLGISLDVPSNFINGSDGFNPPIVANMNSPRFVDNKSYNQSSSAPFLYQAPSSKACLIFGDKWAALHNFVSNRITASHTGKAEKTKKVVAETEPAWMEFLLELMRARGWNVLCPPVPLATVHNDLSQIPEEFLREKTEGQKGSEVSRQSNHPEEEPFLLGPDAPTLATHLEREGAGYVPLHELLPFNGDLLELPHLPHLSYRGVLFNPIELRPQAEEFAITLRQYAGGCDAKDAARKRAVTDIANTDDLFCLPGMELSLDSERAERDSLFGPEVVASAVQQAVNKADAAAAQAEEATTTSATTSTAAASETLPPVGVMVESEMG
ncbi:hypothetical protein BAUCODRAFT_78758 [Baudoinia panamericana UAMH 10762]|uniref:Uncharacterized protein n=1 Tax=Baudoinia panamericana (strain UAMH 10762) TaxID=717646 RepID=M2LCB8_BAUPA|nr:uncharacterized protein BAUCODRAFT_78758 [Baudoinia panamericana UAMH 10762]EMC91587.1 hypothetical protein BAUCODRAFT_78758 [Baudoinia panamericana UAMH 10762]